MGKSFMVTRALHKGLPDGLTEWPLLISREWNQSQKMLVYSSQVTLIVYTYINQKQEHESMNNVDKKIWFDLRFECKLKIWCMWKRRKCILELFVAREHKRWAKNQIKWKAVKIVANLERQFFNNIRAEMDKVKDKRFIGGKKMERVSFLCANLTFL